MNEYLSQTWQNLVSLYTSDAGLINRLWDELEKAYTAPARHYHNLHHLETMFRLAEEHQATLRSPDLVRFAIFFHDAVYSSARSDNEEKSAQLAQNRLQALAVPDPEIASVAEMILATKTHQPGAHPDTNLLLDFDLAILSAPWDAYLQYSQQIRKEYSLYPDFLYRQGRKKVLRHFLEKDSIYQTPAFQTLAEPQARQNLARELALLEQS